MKNKNFEPFLGEQYNIFFENETNYRKIVGFYRVAAMFRPQAFFT